MEWRARFMDKRTVAQMKWMSVVGAILLFAALLANYGTAEASDTWDYSPLVLRDASLGYRGYFAGGRDRLLSQNGLPDRQPGQELSLTLKTDFLTYGYWDSLIHGGTDHDVVNGGGQFRDIGLQLRLGVRPFQWLEVGYYHHSQHLLDTGSELGFPVLDGWELNINLFKSKATRESLF
jgi:hypothetical protein